MPESFQNYVFHLVIWYIDLNDMKSICQVENCTNSQSLLFEKNYLSILLICSSLSLICSFNKRPLFKASFPDCNIWRIPELINKTFHVTYFQIENHLSGQPILRSISSRAGKITWKKREEKKKPLCEYDSEAQANKFVTIAPPWNKCRSGPRPRKLRSACARVFDAVSISIVKSPLGDDCTFVGGSELSLEKQKMPTQRRGMQEDSAHPNRRRNEMRPMTISFRLFFSFLPQSEVDFPAKFCLPDLK